MLTLSLLRTLRSVWELSRIFKYAAGNNNKTSCECPNKAMPIQGISNQQPSPGAMP
jgi:hypothetical protein